MNKTITVLLLTASWGASAAESFANPSDLCTALALEGFETNGWRLSRAAAGEWACLSAPVEFGRPGSGGIPNSMVFYVHGTSATRAEEVLISVDINNPSERDAAFARLHRVTESLFQKMGEPVPAALIAGLSERRPSTVATSIGTAELTMDTGRVDSAKLILRNVAQPESNVHAADQQADFAACLDAVSKATGFSPSQLVADSEPTSAGGQMGFMFMGQGKDLFFCEVHGSGRYRVKAALNGDFHFRYLADGQF